LIFLKALCDSDAVHKQLSFVIAIWQFAENGVAQSTAVADFELFTAGRGHEGSESFFLVAARDHGESWSLRLRIDHDALNLRLRA
jgi:hypothetical protein